MTMFIAQLFLCSAITNNCVGLQDDTRVVRDFSACEKRIEEMITDAGILLPDYKVMHVGCTKLPGLSV